MDRRRSRGVSLGIVLGVLAGGCGSPDPQAVADYPAYGTVQELVDAADVVVTGRVVETREEQMPPDDATGSDPSLNPQAGLDATESSSAVPVTVAVVEVARAIKGDLQQGDRIEVSQPGQAGDEIAGSVLVEEGAHTYAFVLSQYDDAPYSLVNPEQGLYVVGEDGDLSSVVDGAALAIDHIEDLASGL